MAINWQAAREGDACPPIYYSQHFFREAMPSRSLSTSRRTSMASISRCGKKAGWSSKAPCATRPESPCRRRSSSSITATCCSTSSRPIPTHKGITKSKAWETASSWSMSMPYTADSCERAPPSILTRRARKCNATSPCIAGVLISGKLVDEDGKEWQIGESYGYANTVKYEHAQGPAEPEVLGKLQPDEFPEQIQAHRTPKKLRRLPLLSAKAITRAAT